jgi:hypothetical protein
LLTFQELFKTLPLGQDDPYTVAASALRVTSRLDILTFFLFGARKLEWTFQPTSGHPFALADVWLPVRGDSGGFESVALGLIHSAPMIAEYRDIMALKELISKIFVRIFEGLAHEVYRQATPRLIDGDPGEGLVLGAAKVEAMRAATTDSPARRLSEAEADALAVLAHDLNELLTMAMTERVETEERWHATMPNSEG